MAGVRKEEVKVLVEDGNILQISGERTEEDPPEDNKNNKWHRVERRRATLLGGSGSRRTLGWMRSSAHLTMEC